MKGSGASYEGRPDAAEACLEAYRLCKGAAIYCRDGESAERTRGCAAGLEDCADFALLLANVLTRRSPHMRNTAVLCGEVARRTAGSISHLEHADANLRPTFAVCQNLVRICSDLIGESRPARDDERDEAVAETFPASDAPPSVSQPT